MIVKVRVHPKSKERRIEKISENEFEIWIKEEPLDGKANREIVKILSKEFNVDWRAINIKNASSRSKIVEIKEVK